MRVLFLSPHYPPDVAATGQLVAELAEDLVADGHQAVVLASRPSVSDQPGKRYRLLEKENRDGIEIHWLGVPTSGRRGTWSRLLPFGAYFIAAFFRAIFMRRVDVVFAQSTPPLLAGLLGAILSLVPGRKFVYNLQDVYPDLGQALGVLDDNLLSRISRRVESALRHRADKLVVLAGDMQQRVLNKDPHLDNIVVVPNWADSNLIAPVDHADNEFRVAHGLQDQFVVMYSGNLGRAHGVEILSDVAAMLADIDDLTILVIGEGAAKAALQEEVNSQQLKNIRFLPYQDKTRLKESLSAADVGLILQREAVAGLVVPSKLYGILASGRPSVAAVPEDTEVARVLEQEAAGLVVKPGSAKSIADAIRELYRSPSAAREMGERARLAAVDRHDRKKATGRYIQLLKQISTS